MMLTKFSFIQTTRELSFPITLPLFRYAQSHPTVKLLCISIVLFQLTGIFNVLLPPRTLGSITTNSTCRLYVRDGRFEDREIVEVQVYEPQYCDPSSPQAYCSELSVPSDRVCETYSGSPLVCNAQSVDGIFLQSECREISPERYLIVYHSVGEFSDWIESVSTIESSAVFTGKISSFFLLSAIVISLIRSL